MNSVGGEVTRIALELERDVEPIRGRVLIADQPAREFAGMLELMTLLDAVRASRIPEGNAT
jgi:hypothetical protein